MRFCAFCDFFGRFSCFSWLFFVKFGTFHDYFSLNLPLKIAHRHSGRTSCFAPPRRRPRSVPAHPLWLLGFKRRMANTPRGRRRHRRCDSHAIFILFHERISWYFFDVSMMLLRCFYDTFMLLLWYYHDIIICFHDVSMIILWYFHALFMTFPICFLLCFHIISLCFLFPCHFHTFFPWF